LLFIEFKLGTLRWMVWQETEGKDAWKLVTLSSVLKRSSALTEQVAPHCL